MDIEEIEKLALNHIKKYLPGWSFKFKNTISIIGYCSFKYKTIYFSKVYAFLDKDKIENTILHEIAHGIGTYYNHGEEWKSTAISIGCKNPGFSYSLKPEDYKHVHFKYEAICEKCKTKYYRQRKPDSKLNYFCANCIKLDPTNKVYLNYLKQY